MKNLTIKVDLIGNKIEIVYGFEVYYTPTIVGKDFNNNGTWGKITDKGEIVHSVNYNPNKIAVNFGESDYQTQLSFMKRQLAVYQSLQPKQIQKIIKKKLFASN